MALSLVLSVIHDVGDLRLHGGRGPLAGGKQSLGRVYLVGGRGGEKKVRGREGEKGRRVEEGREAEAASRRGKMNTEKAQAGEDLRS